jgi:hypothetical protein
MKGYPYGDWHEGTYPFEIGQLLQVSAQVGATLLTSTMKKRPIFR